MTTTYSVTRDDIIKSSLRLLGVLGIGETPVTEELTNGSMALNILIKAFQTQGLPLWKIQHLVLPMVTGNNTYQIGPTATGTGALVTDRPLRITSAFLRDNTMGNDVTMQIFSREEYDMLGIKTSQGTPNSIYYDPQLTNGVLHVYNTPVDSTHTMYLDAQIPISDLNNGTDTFDLPQEWYQVLKYALANELGYEYQISIQKQALLEGKTQMWIDKMMDWSVEEASVSFSPNMSMRK